MRSLGRGLLASLAGLLVAVVLAVPAHAANTVTASCELDGTVNADVQWLDGGTAPYDSYGWINLICAVEVSPAGTADVETVHLDTVGDFSNLVCGTGTAGDADPVVLSVTSLLGNAQIPPILKSANLSYNVVFAGGQGLLTFTDQVNSASSVPRTVPTATDPVGGGYVTLGVNSTFPADDPPPVGAPNGLCAHSFLVVGAVTGVLLQ